MSRILGALVVLAACKGDPTPAPTSGSASAAPAPSDATVAPAFAVQCQPAAPAPRTAAELVGHNGGIGIASGAGGVGMGITGSSRDGGYPGRRVVDPAGVVFGEITTTGALDVPLVKRYLRRHKAKLDACYRNALAARPTLGGGKQDIQIGITETGTVGVAQVTGVDDTVAACMKTALETIEFPKPKSGTVAVRVTWELRANSGYLTPPIAPEPTAWTPFAVAPVVGDRTLATATADQIAAELPKLASLDRCFGDKPGRLRAMISIVAGAEPTIRAGGIGDRIVEQCFEQALGAIAARPATGRVEVACDLVKGDGIDMPWRVTPERYDVIDVDAKSFTRAGKTTPADAIGIGLGNAGDPTKTYLFLAKPDATGFALSRAMIASRIGAASLVAIAASGGAPVFIGMGPDGRKLGLDESGPLLELAAKHGKLRACVGGKPLPTEASLLVPAEVDGVIAAAIAACDKCAPTAKLGLANELVVKDLVAVASALARAKRPTFTIGGVACADPL